MALVRDAVEVVVGIGVIAALVFSGLNQSRAPGIVAGPSPALGTSPSLGGYSLGAPAGDSPVKIVGGSMTFRAMNGWSGSPLKTSSSVDTSIIQLDRVALPDAGSGPGFVTFPNIATAWQIEVDARDSTGKNLSGNGVFVCAEALVGGNAACDLTKPLLNSITIIPIDKANPGKIGFYSTDAPPFLSSSSSYQGKRYQDQTCTVEGTFCEHIARIIITFAGKNPITYLCPDGECRVYVGPIS